jgi:hypothetical protein
MNYPRAIVVAAGLIAGALVLTSSGHGQSPGIGKYGAAHDSTGGVWRIDTTTGGVARCTVNVGGQIQCTQPAMP